jgi:hypothetical protein
VPALTMCALHILLLPLQAGSVPLDRPLPVGCTDDVMQYDDGIASWIWFEGMARGVWFNTDDFYPGASSAVVNDLEFWFYENAGSYPWDTASFYAELWNGDYAGPDTQLDQTSITAFHYAPCFANYATPIPTEVGFWGLINTEMSAGGWPSILLDNTPDPVNHSFFLSDESVWEPVIIQGPTANDFFIRADAAPPGGALDQSTWGAIKTLF